MQAKQISRAEFVRFSGLVGLAGLAGEGSLMGNVLRPDESSLEGHPHMPWWVRAVAEPTIGVDWEHLQRFDVRNAVLANGMNFAEFVSPQEYEHLEATFRENQEKRIEAGTPGYTLEDHALTEALMVAYAQNRSFLGPRQARPPEERGVARWEGDPAQGTRMLRAAMRNFGTAQVGIVELNERTRKLIYSHDPDGKALVFEDVAEAYETAEKRVIPERVRWAVVYLVQLPIDAMKRAPTRLVTMAAHLTYERAKIIQNSTQEFLRGLGYQGLGQIIPCSIGVTPALAVMAGLGEMSRLNRLISPVFGPMVSVFTLLTDLPLVPDGPIDAGIIRFCKTCRKCAEACPAGALSIAENPDWQVAGRWNNPGHQAYFDDAVKCYTHWRQNAGSYCSICFAVCPFSKKDKAWIYDLVKASVASTHAFNGFYRSMDDAFSYGQQHNLTEWWHLDLPEYGTNSERPI